MLSSGRTNCSNFRGGPPYDNWFIDGNPTITDDCQLGVSDLLRNEISIYPSPMDEVFS
ncbi:hypothetical protein ATE92_0760 [Ulvibacter sp. MAR_2010_11]|uniref:hypothetical protein n=1 Tax=Ulvibacter sp. MAR_2010_11 TaxID=1250229 RepID=UPI000CBC84AA|nr:hypothetical protein [Ulvibacter sp. MAR_2010_11]PKA82626.1 hypothetical protein ATE92_0760 [Ulvibacter sp. MAR_2010_11]